MEFGVNFPVNVAPSSITVKVPEMFAPVGTIPQHRSTNTGMLATNPRLSRNGNEKQHFEAAILVVARG